jgi:hypothetical protein
MILESCLYIFKSLPSRGSIAPARRILRSTAHILASVSAAPLPAPVENLLRSSALQRHIAAYATSHFVHEEQIVLDVLHLLRVCASAGGAVPALIAHVAEPSDCSLLAQLNRVLVLRLLQLEKLDGGMSSCTRAIFCTLFFLVRNRLLPASVAFEPASVRAICRHLAKFALLTKDSGVVATECTEDIAAMLHILHHISVTEQAPLTAIALRESIGFIFAVRVFLQHSAIFAGIEGVLSELAQVAEKAMLADICSGKHTPQAMPVIRQRDHLLAHDEEMDMYRRIDAAL